MVPATARELRAPAPDIGDVRVHPTDNSLGKLSHARSKCRSSGTAFALMVSETFGPMTLVPMARGVFLEMPVGDARDRGRAEGCLSEDSRYTPRRLSNTTTRTINRTRRMTPPPM
jgi:hypothetical protein